MTEQEKKGIEQFMSSYNTMRKYQKKFFGGDKASLKTAMYWENQTDNYAAKVVADNHLQIAEGKGNATQGTML